MDGEIADAAASRGDLAPSALGDDDRIAWAKIANLVVNRDHRCAVDQEDQYVALVVHVLGRSVDSTSSEQGRVEIVRRLTPDRAAPERTSGGLEPTSSQPLDQRKQLPLLAPHVRLEQLADLAHHWTHVG
jgi:hypothetical protein